MKLTWSDFSFDFSKKTYVMGILNVTPDSFSDGGAYFNCADAVEQGLQMVEDGADIIDLGGESTRPDSNPVTVKEELKRIIPVIEALAGKVRVPISIDTYKAEVARQALKSGASMVNDVSGLRADSGMAKVVAEYGVPVVIMHMKGSPKDMQVNPVYEALIPEIIDYLRISIRLALKFGVREDMIIIDPGIGFGKTMEHNLEILGNLEDFTCLQKPVLIGASRKAFIGKLLGDAGPLKRINGTAAAVAVSVMKGANMVRVHDVSEMAGVVKVADAIKKASISAG